MGARRAHARDADRADDASAIMLPAAFGCRPRAPGGAVSSAPTPAASLSSRPEAPRATEWAMLATSSTSHGAPRRLHGCLRSPQPGRRRGTVQPQLDRRHAVVTVPIRSAPALVDPVAVAQALFGPDLILLNPPVR